LRQTDLMFIFITISIYPWGISADILEHPILLREISIH
jgi:hypothetical protein